MDAERSLAELYRSSFTSNATLLLLIPYASLYEVGFDGSEQTLGQAPLRIVQLPLPNLAPQAAPAAEGAGKPWYAFAPASGSKGKATVKKYDRISSMDVIGAEEELSSAAPNVLTYLFVGSFGAIPLVPDLQPLRVSPRVYIFPMDDDTASSANPVTWGAENPSGRMLFRVEFPASVGGPFLLAFERLLARLTVYTSPWVYSSDESQAERLSEGADLIEYLKDEQIATLAQYRNSLCLMDDKGRIIGVMDSGLPVLYGEDGHEAGAHGAKEAVVVDVLAEGDDLEDSEDEENGENRTSSSLPRRPDTVAIADEPPPALPYRPEATPPLPERASDSATASSSPAAPAAQPPAKGGIATLPQMLLNKAITLIGPDNVAKGQETVVKGVAKGHEMINEGVARGQQMFSGGVKAAETQLTRAGVKLPTPVMLMFQRVSGGNQVQAEITPAQSGKENTAAGAAAAPLLSQQAAAEANAYIPRGITTVGNPSERGIAVGGATTARALPSASNTPAAGTSSNASAVASSAVVEVEEVIEVIDISGTAQAAEKKPLLTLEQKEKLVRGVTGAMKYYVRVRPVAAKAVKQFSKHAKKDKSKQGPAKRVVASIAKVGLKTMDLVVATGEKSVENFVKDASSAVVDPVRKKYGKGAAELAQSAVETVAMVYIDDKGISRKAVVKKATKQVVSELVVVGESSSSSSTSVTKKKK